MAIMHPKHLVWAIGAGAAMLLTVPEVRADSPPSGTLLAWGDNTFGELGNGTSGSYTNPISNPVPGGVLGISDVVSMSCKSNFAVALRSDGTVWTWGDNTFGELGDGTNLPHVLPTQVPNLTGVIKVIAGNSHCVALKSDGTVWSWGNNYEGQLGIGSNVDSSSPVQVTALNDISDIAAGYFQNFALGSDGSVWAWGQNNFGQLGNGTNTDSPSPTRLLGLSDIISISCGSYHSFALKSDGTVLAWGRNLWGELGDGTTVDRNSPVEVQNLSDVRSIAGGYIHSLAVRADGSLWAWGDNGAGELGVGSYTSTATPVKIPNSKGVISVSAGNFTSMALLSDGSVWSWGLNDIGETGTGLPDNSLNAPTLIPGLKDILAIVNGATFSMALSANVQPVLLSVSPAVVVAGSNGVTLALTGSAFTPASKVVIDGSEVPTTYLDHSTLKAQVAANYIQSPGNVQVAVSDSTRTLGTSRVKVLRIVAANLNAISVSSTNIAGSVGSAGTVALNGPAPAGGVQVSLTSSDPAVSVPATVTITEGATSQTFAITTSDVNADTSTIITATLDGVTKRIAVTVKAPTIRAFSLSSATVFGGDSVSGTISLTGPAGPAGYTVNLTSSGGSVVTLAPTITVPAGANTATFPVATTPVDVATLATITATVPGRRPLVTSLSIMPPALTALSAPSSAQGGTPVTLTATLGSPAPAGGVSIRLTSSMPGVLRFAPSTLTVPAGATSASVDVTPSKVKASVPVTVAAILARVTQKTSITITP